jgi:hypothetical protein
MDRGLSVTVSICSALSLDRWTSHAEVAQASVHPPDLCFKIGNDVPEVPLARAAPKSILAFALAQ